MSKKITTKDFIQKANEKHGNDRYDYSNVIYKKACEKVEIKCNKCNKIFYQTPNNHLNGQGCPYCKLDKCRKSRLLPENIFLIRSNKIHGDKFDYSKIQYTNTHIKIEIKCNTCGKSFWQTPHNHLQGRGCPYCCGKYKIKKQIIKEFQEIHGKGKYDYSEVEYINNRTKVKIFCNKCKKIFLQTPNSHLQGHGCPYCATKQTHQKQKYTLKKFIQKAQQIHGKNKYDYNQTKYIDSNTKVKIFCNKCKKYFWQVPKSHLQGCGCLQCQYNNMRILKSFTPEEFINLSKKIHGDKFDYSKIKYLNIKTKVIIYCNKCKKYFWQRPENHLQGCGCPYCGIISRGEEIIKKILKEHNINFETQKRFDNCRDKNTLPFDFYLPDYNICIEYQGKQHYKEGIIFFEFLTHSKDKANKMFEKLQYHDQIKKDYCKKNNILLMEIKYSDKIEEKLYQIIRKENNVKN